MHTAIGNFEIGDLVATTHGTLNQPFAQGIIAYFDEKGRAVLVSGCREYHVDVDRLTFVED